MRSLNTFGTSAGSLPNTGSRQISASWASALPSTCRGSFLCKTGYSRIRSAYGSVFKPRIRLSAAGFEPRLRWRHCSAERACSGEIGDSSRWRCKDFDLEHVRVGSFASNLACLSMSGSRASSAMVENTKIVTRPTSQTRRCIRNAVVYWLKRHRLRNLGAVRPAENHARGKTISVSTQSTRGESSSPRPSKSELRSSRPRKRGARETRSVIASEAKLSMSPSAEAWIASPRSLSSGGPKAGPVGSSQ
jgi:hypothetical protein